MKTTPIQFCVDTKYIKHLRKSLPELDDIKITAHALGLLTWAVDELNKGNVVIAINPDGTQPVDLLQLKNYVKQP